jgi:peptide/nickel transport system permease protein
MITYVLRRVAWSLLVLLVVAVVAYLLTFVAPADPAKSIAGPKSTAESVERIRASLGLDRPPLEQMADYLVGVARLDFGVSYQTGGVAVIDLILRKLPATLELAIAGVLLAIAIGVPLGVASARRPGSRLDRVGAVLSSMMISLPSFLLGLLLIYVFAFRFRTDLGIALFPIANSSYHPLDVAALALPAITLGITVAPFYVRVSRAVMIDELRSHYVRTARAKGLPEGAVVWRHAFRNALPQVVTLIGLDLGFLLGGVVVVEAVFSWPGIGQLAARSITSEDVPVLMGTLLFGTLCIVIANLLVDLVYAALDPRVVGHDDVR